MNGGTIANNTATEIGGGVFIYQDAYYEGIFTMNGGTIKGNTSGRIGGGGVGLYPSATFIKNAKGIIYGFDGGVNANKANNDFGHAAFVKNVGNGDLKRDLTIGEGDVIRWGSGTPVGWDNPALIYSLLQTAEKITGEKIAYLFLDEVQVVCRNLEA